MSNFFNNGQRMPNIFERARAYDNWNEGNFPPQEDGYEDTYNTLSNDEKSFVYRHPILAYKFNNNANKAKSAVEHFPNKKDGYGDAIYETNNLYNAIAYSAICCKSPVLSH